MEIRPSDVVLAAGDVLNKGSDALQRLHDREYQAQRVQQVNDQLAALSFSEQQYQRTKVDREYDRQYDNPNARSFGTGVAKVDFGNATQQEVEADHAKFVKAQIDYITKNVTNPTARQELLWHLGQQAVPSLSKAIDDWRVYHQHTALASLEKVSDVTLADPSLPWDVKSARIKSRVDAVVSAGDMWPDVGEKYLADKTSQAQYSDAYNGAMGAMQATGNPLAANEWVDKNTPYFNADPATREKVKKAVWQDFSDNLRMQEWSDKTQTSSVDAEMGTALLQLAQGKSGALTNSMIQKGQWPDSNSGEKKAEWMTKRRTLIDSLTSGGIKISPAEQALLVKKIIDFRNDPTKSNSQYQDFVTSALPRGLTAENFEQYYAKKRPDTPISQAVTQIFSKAVEGAYPLMSPQDAASARIALDKEIEKARETGKPYTDTDVQQRVAALMLPYKMAQIKSRMDKAAKGSGQPTEDEKTQYKQWQEATAKYAIDLHDFHRGGRVGIGGAPAGNESIQTMQMMIDRGQTFGMADNILLKPHLDELRTQYGQLFQSWSGKAPEAEITLTAPRYGGRAVYGMKTLDGRDLLFTPKMNPTTHYEDWYVFDPQTDEMTLVTDDMRVQYFGGKK